jgi:hypothetical protein
VDIIYLDLLDVAGNPVSGPNTIVSMGLASATPVIAWTGSEFGLAWQDGTSLYFSRVSAPGAKIGSDVFVKSTTYPVTTDLEWTGSEYLLGWTENSNAVWVDRLSWSGSKLDIGWRKNAAQMTHDEDGKGFIAWTGSKLGVVFSESGALSLEILDPLLSSGSPAIALGNGEYPTIEWNGSQLAIAFGHSTSAMNVIYTDESGVITDDVNVVNWEALQTPDLPNLSWTGSEYGVIWVDFLEPTFEEVYYSRIGMCD